MEASSARVGAELARLLFGADRPEQGSMTLEGEPYAPRGPADAVKSGVGFVPEERRVEGLILSKSLAFNLGLANLQSIIFQPSGAIHQRQPPEGARRARHSRPRDQSDQRRDAGRTAQRRQSTKSRHRRWLGVEAQSAHSGRTDSRRRRRRAGRNPSSDSQPCRQRAWRCLSYPPSPRSCRTCATGRLLWRKAGSLASWPARR